VSHKVHPYIFRLGHSTDWKSKWFSKKKYKEFLKQDYELRNFIVSNLKQSAIEKVEISRSANLIKIKIYSARPGIIIGRGGTGIQNLKKELINEVFNGHIKGLDIKIDIEEVKNPEACASIAAQNIAEQLERRMPFRRVMKQSLNKIIQNSEVKGAKVSISGRLGGTEMARREWLRKGELPLQTIRADIDYVQVNAHTNYGIIGVKVWIYKGEVFNNR